MNLTCWSPNREDVSVRVRVTFTDAGGYWPWSMTPAGWSEAVRPDKCNIPLPLITAAWAVIISGVWHELFEEEDKSPRLVKGLYIFGTITDYWSSSLLLHVQELSPGRGNSTLGPLIKERESRIIAGWIEEGSQLFLGHSRSYGRKEMGYFHTFRGKVMMQHGWEREMNGMLYNLNQFSKTLVLSSCWKFLVVRELTDMQF